MKITKPGVHRQEPKRNVWPLDSELTCPKCECGFTVDGADLKAEGGPRVFRSRTPGTRAMLRTLCPDCFKPVEIMEPLNAGFSSTPPAVIRSRSSKRTMQIQ